MGRGFKRTVENFVCENCGEEVVGNGYTNHCPSCLWSKHVDNAPGDRAALEECGCLMEPVSIEQRRGRFAIEHRCIGCGLTHINRISPEDNMDEVLAIAERNARKKGRRG